MSTNYKEALKKGLPLVDVADLMKMAESLLDEEERKELQSESDDVKALGLSLAYAAFVSNFAVFAQGFAAPEDEMGVDGAERFLKEMVPSTLENKNRAEMFGYFEQEVEGVNKNLETALREVTLKLLDENKLYND